MFRFHPLDHFHADQYAGSEMFESLVRIPACPIPAPADKIVAYPPMIGISVPLRVLVPWQQLVEELKLPGVEPILWHINDDPNDAPPADVLVTERPCNPQLRSRVTRIKGLKHVHRLSIGYKWVPEHLPEQVSLTNSKGAVEDATAEHCLALTLASLRQPPQVGQQHRERQWPERGPARCTGQR